ncbi:MAG: methionine--tRNA ligase [Bacteroidia bacterium]
MSSSERYTITAALPYANGPLHLGHIAGVYLPADIFVRYLRMKGKDVAFICGSDEHGAAITLRAKKEGITPQEIVDKYHAINQKAFSDFHISFDIYHRTSSELHHKTAQDFFTVLNNNGKFSVQKSEQFYDEEHHQFLADRYITGECPKCANPSAYGDQCEKCGTSLSPTDLKNPISTLSGKTPTLKSTSHWYLPMNEHEAWLKEWIQQGTLDGKPHHNPSEWKNHVVGQCMSWLDGGLHARAMTRDLDWGVKVPVEGADGKVLYVWLDAPIGYISATKQWAADNGKNWEDYWKDSQLIHFIGKDNIVFHCIIFPILLKAHGDFILPQNVPAYEFLNLEGDKFSTSRNWAVWLHEYMAAHPDKIDELKYVLTAIAPENRDSEFTWKEYQIRVNNELADVFGNFVNRAAVLTHKYFEGKIPALGNLEAIDKDVLEQLQAFPEKIDALIQKYKLKEAQFEAMNLARLGNKYLADTEPWKLAKTNPERVNTILNIALQITANLTIAFEPFMPLKAQQLRCILNINTLPISAFGKSDILSEGHQLNASEILFSKIEDEFVAAEVEKLKQNQPPTMFEPQKDTVEFDDFMKMDIRIGKIVNAEKVEKADKLLKLTVDTGLDQRTIVSGIAEHYSPEEIIGKEVTLLMNLPPRKIRGVESQGMILMAEDKDGKLSFLQPKDGFKGATVR